MSDLEKTEIRREIIETAAREAIKLADTIGSEPRPFTPVKVCAVEALRSHSIPAVPTVVEGEIMDAIDELT